MDFKTYISDFRHTSVQQILKKEDQDAEEYVVMVLDADKLLELTELFPKTCVSMKYKALDRRNYYLKKMQE